MQTTVPDPVAREPQPDAGPRLKIDRRVAARPQPPIEGLCEY
jgi:hypothetical protein